MIHYSNLIYRFILPSDHWFHQSPTHPILIPLKFNACESSCADFGVFGDDGSAPVIDVTVEDTDVPKIW